MGGILALDSITAILFARLRQENKALKFAIFKTIKIITETAANLVLFLWFPKYCATAGNSWLLNFIPATPDFSYVIFAIFISCLVCSNCLSKRLTSSMVEPEPLAIRILRE